MAFRQKKYPVHTTAATWYVGIHEKIHSNELLQLEWFGLGMYLQKIITELVSIIFEILILISIAKVRLIKNNII